MFNLLRFDNFTNHIIQRKCLNVWNILKMLDINTINNSLRKEHKNNITKN